MPQPAGFQRPGQGSLPLNPFLGPSYASLHPGETIKHECPALPSLSSFAMWQAAESSGAAKECYGGVKCLSPAQPAIASGRKT